MRTFFVAGILGISVLAGCVGIVDTTGGDDTTNPNPDPNPNPNPNPDPNPNPNPTPTPALAATLDKSTVATELGKTETLTVSLIGSGGFAGDVTFTPSVVDAGGAPVMGWTFTQAPATVTLTANGTMAVTLAVMIPSNSASLATTVKLDVSASAVPTVNLSSAFTVANQYTITIKAGTGTSPPAHVPSFPSTLTIKAGAKLVFHNADNIVHRIHGAGGIVHEAGDLQPGANYTVTPSGDGQFYCHDHDGGIVNNLNVQ